VRAAGSDAPPLTLALVPGDRVGLLGVSGTELSGLLRTLAGLQKPAEGRLYRNGIDVTRRPRWLLSQRMRAQVLLLWADPYVLFGDHVQVRTATKGEAPARLRASRLSPALHAFEVGTLSGLERTRVALAYVRRRGSQVILIDDVFSHLVPEAWPELLADLDGLAGEAGAIVIASRLPRALQTMKQLVDLGAGAAAARG